jgi:hypothetical protein
MANVKLSKEELELVTDANLILTKNRIIQKVYELFGELSEDYRQRSSAFPVDVITIAPKISKGENYLGLPWVMLDYPRKFSNTDVLAIRNFFWWGNYFSITLQLQGSYKQQYQRPIKKYLESTREEWWIGIAGEPWQHHFESDNYGVYSNKVDLEKLPFIKLAKKIPLQEWDNSFDFFTGTYNQFLEMLST